MEKQLNGKKILVLVANGVDESVMSVVQRDLLKAGATVKTAGMEAGLVNSWNVSTWGLYFPVDQQIGRTLGSDFDALVVPSGERGVQKLSTSPHSERIVSSFLTSGRPMALMGNAAALLEKIGLAGAENNANVLLCDCTDVQTGVDQMIAHLVIATEEVKEAA
jgi:protease I